MLLKFLGKGAYGGQVHSNKSYENEGVLQFAERMALPLGVEPRSSVPETNVLSIELQELLLSDETYKLISGQTH